MALWDVFKINRKTFFYPSAWIDVDYIRNGTMTFWDSIRDLFVTPTPVHEESFDVAMQRLGLTEADIESAQRNYRLYAIIFLILGILVVLFSFYLLIGHYSFTGWLLGLAAASLFFAQAFRFDFWSFQIKHRKLGCTVREWREGKVKESSSP